MSDIRNELKDLQGRINTVEARMGNIRDRAREAIENRVADLRTQVEKQEQAIERLEAQIRDLTP